MHRHVGLKYLDLKQPLPGDNVINYYFEGK